MTAPRLTWNGRKTAELAPRARLSPPTEPSAPAPCRLIEGDNLQSLSALKDELGEAVTLAYLDPPFLTGREHHRISRTKDEESGVIERTQRVAFDDRWDSLADYLASLEPRIRLIRELLTQDGSLVIHVDPKTSHYVKVMCDEIFGIGCFQSEVIWRYRRWPSKTKNFQRVHDVMLRYVKDPSCAPAFNQLYEPLAPSTQATWGDRKQRAVTDSSGRRVRSSKTEDASKGTPLGDVWDISIVAPVAKERTGYPTQKPLALLSRWIAACTQPGDLVLDPYMGSGTTLVAACRDGRRAIGLDVGGEAHEVTRARLSSLAIPHSSQRVDVPLRSTRRAPGHPAPALAPSAQKTGT